MPTDPNGPVTLYIWAWLLPLFSFILLVFGGKRWGRAGAFVALAAIVGSFCLSTYVLILYSRQFSPDFFPSHDAADSHGAPGSHGGHESESKQEHGSLRVIPEPLASLEPNEIEAEEVELVESGEQGQSSTG